MRKYFYIFIGFCLIFLTNCEQKTTTTPSSVAQLSAFSFAAVDSMPGLGAASFKVEERLDTGLVWNKDSMLYGTKLDRVVPRFTFATTPGAATLFFPDTTVQLTGYDTLDFTKTPIYLTIRSQDNKNTKTYEIRATVHQVDPDLYTWEQLTAGIYPSDDSEQRVVELGTDFIMLVSNGFEIYAIRSADGVTWSTPAITTGLPAGTIVRQIISDGTTLYYGQGNAIYTSTDAIHWTQNNVSENVVTMLMHWNDLVWVLIQNSGYQLATYAGGILTLTDLKPTDDFPISDFAAVTFRSASQRERAMIIGGFAENGQSLNTRWNIEYVKYAANSAGEYRLEEFSIDRPAFQSLTGISVIDYNDRLLLFGGVDENMTYLGRDIFISDNEGLSWIAADTAKNQLPETYSARQKQSAIVRDNYIYVFGGQDGQQTYSDVYRGRLNSIDWKL